MANVRNTDSDPFKGKKLPVDIEYDESTEEVEDEDIDAETSESEEQTEEAEAIEESTEL